MALMVVKMTTYFECVNDNNRLQINDTSNCIQLDRTVSMSSLPTIADCGISLSSLLELKSSDVAVAIKTTYNNSYVHYNFIGNIIPLNNKKYYILETSMYSSDTNASGTRSTIFSNIANSTTLYIYGKNIPTDIKCGLEIYNSNGTVVFNSANKPLKVKKQYLEVYNLGETDKSIDDNIEHAFIVSGGINFISGQRVLATRIGVGIWQGKIRFVPVTIPFEALKFDVTNGYEAYSSIATNGNVYGSINALTVEV